jgi:hypothetical protein
MLKQNAFILTIEMPCSTETSLIFNYKTTSCENSKDTNLNIFIIIIIVIVIIIRPDEINTAPAVPC